ncbi:hypothetical protein [Stackebrandtia nassauensis]|uniref:Uncharacterized protein n=1 Tax=Stackebrandtia nassauensis (strain DSM 44728 / CIP 108903 / NRRL B-16338 / NBRC 102104 / LLR-40K-21) TaxID=446470 RepID=D3PX37_STANL|nr:hypothetical protein [Stackebrandtia nassauensis]ADD45261.1 hypothetical protein Snas_5631 [Stackebrandtia nassauensis DSM 44728]
MTGGLDGKVTLASQRQVLAVTRNRASVFRLLEILKLFDDDDRVTIRTTIGPDSRYDHGVDQLLVSQRIRPLPWHRATQSTFDLAVSGTTHASLRELKAPVVVFPHGAGHHKRPPAVTSGGEVFELMPQQLLHNGSVIPSRILLPGPDSLRRLRLGCGAAVPHAVIAGDPIAQQLRAHRPLRDSYRAAFGLRPGQRLVLVASSWGPGSLAGQSLELIKRLVAELPVDEYRIAAAFHHNVTIHDGQRDLERRLRAALDSGLILIPPTAAWQPAVIAADVVIGDGGSISFYAADGTPVAIAAHDPSEYPDDGPVAALVDAVPHLDPKAPLPPQVERLVAEGRPAAVEAILDSSIDRRIDAAGAFRTVMYELMDLPEPAVPAFLPLAKPELKWDNVTAFVVHSAVDPGNRTVTLTRYPAATATVRAGRHLVVRTDDADPRRPQTAAALVAVNPEPSPAELLRRFPGCRVVARPSAEGRCVLRDRDGTEYLAVVSGSPIATVELAASTYYVIVQAGLEPLGGFTVGCGGQTVSIHFSHSPVD